MSHVDFLTSSKIVSFSFVVVSKILLHWTEASGGREYFGGGQ